MKATKKLLLFAFVAALMITMFVAFAVTASAADEDTTIGFKSGVFNGNITYGDAYDLSILTATDFQLVMEQTSGGLDNFGTAKPVYKLVDQNGADYAAGSPAGKYYLILESLEINGTKIEFVYDFASSGLGVADYNGVKVRANSGIVMVEKKAVTITFAWNTSNPSKVYDGTPDISGMFMATIEGLFGTDSLDYDYVAKLTQANVGTDIAVASVDVTLNGISDNNYFVTNVIYAGLTADITARPLWIKLTNPTKTYGDPDDLSFTYIGLVDGEFPAYDIHENEVIPTRAIGQDVGKYAVDAGPIYNHMVENGKFNPNNYKLNNTPYTENALDTGDYYTIVKRDVYIKFDKTVVFNNAVYHYDILTDGALSSGITIENLATGDQADDKIVALFTGAFFETSYDDVGVYLPNHLPTDPQPKINSHFSDAAWKNYMFNLDGVKIEITPLKVTVDLVNDDATRTYDATEYVITDKALFDFTVYGTVESVSVTVGTNAGKYPFNTLTFTAVVKDGDEDESKNYAFDTTASTKKVTIKKAELKVNVTASKEYDGTPFVFDMSNNPTEVTFTGLCGKDAVTTGKFTSLADAGTYYDIMCNVSTLPADIQNNYDLIAGTIKIEISKREIRFTINYSKTYDGAIGIAGVEHITVDRLCEGHELTGITLKTNGVNVKEYGPANFTEEGIVIKANGGANVTANYHWAYDGNLKITPAEITVSKVQITKAYYYNGKTTLNPANVVIEFAGLVGSETLTVGTDYTITDSAWTSANAGTNTVVFTVNLQDTTAANNYEIVPQAEYTTSGTNKAINKCYVRISSITLNTDYDRYYDATKVFDVNQIVTVKFAVNGSMGAIVDPIALNITDENKGAITWRYKNAGTDELHIVTSKSYVPHIELNNDNYAFASYYYDIKVNVTIRPAKLYIVPDAAQNKVYGEKTPAIDFNYYVEGKTLADNANWNYDEVAEVYDGTIIKAAGENAGLYDYDLGTFALKNNGAFLVANYELVLPEEYFDDTNALDANKFEIVKRTVVVTPKNSEKVYWDAEPTLDYNFKVNTSFDNYDLNFSIKENAIYVYESGVWTEITEKNLIFKNEVLRDGYNATRADSVEAIGTYNVVGGTLALLDEIAANYTLVVDETTDVNNTYEVKFDSAINERDKTETIIGTAHDEFVIKAAKITFYAKDLTITYGDVFGTDYKYYFYLDVINSTEDAILGTYKGTDLTYAAIDALTDRTLVLADGLYKFTFAEGFTCAYPNTDAVNAGVYTDMIKFYDEADVALVGDANNNVTLKGFEYGTLTVNKKDIKLAFENISVVYGTVAPEFTIVAAEDYSFVGTDTFENSFQIETDKFRYATTYSSTSSVGTYEITNNCEITTAFYSNNYNIVYWKSAALNEQIKPGSITVTPKTLTLVPYVGTFDPSNIADIGKAYGATNPTIEYAIVGLVGTQKANGTYDVSIKDYTENVGIYEFVLNSYTLTNDTESGFFAQNYTLVISDEVKFHIFAATLELQGNLVGSDMIYNGGVAYNGTFDFSGITDKNGVDITGLTFTVVANFADKNVLNDGDLKPLTIVSVKCGDPNYKVTFDASLTAEAKIVKKTITATNITANDKVYDATDIATVFIPVNAKDIFADMIAGDDLKVAATAIFVNGKNVADNDGETDNVKITIALGGSDAGNYELATTEIIDTAVITKATVTITGISAKDKVYDGLTNVEFVIDENALVGVYDGDELYIANVEGAFADANVGVEKAIVIVTTLGGADLGNYKVAASSQTSANATITPATITVTLADLQKEYGYMINGYVDFSYTNSAFAELAGSELHSALEVNYTTTYDETVANKRKVGSYAIGATVVVKTMMNDDSVVSTNNYIVVVENATLAIYQAVLNVTVDTPAAIIYGDAIPTFTYSADGFKFDDDESVIIGTPVYNCTYMQGSGVGSYPVNLANNLYATNYVINYNGAFLTVNKATLTITPNDTTVIYGETVKCDGYTVSGLLNGDTEAVISGTVKYGFVNTADSSEVAKFNVGTYTIVITDCNLSATNYTFEYTNTAVLTVEKATLTVVPNDVTLVYGEAFANNGYTFDGLVYGDTTVELTGEVGYSVVFKNVGTYTITAIVDGVTADNYVIVAGEGTLTVEKAPLTIKAFANGTITYGDLAPAQSFYYYEATGLIAGDVLAEQVTGTAVYATDYQQNSNAGEYAINVSGLEAQNYEITYEAGTLTVEKKALTVKPVDTTITFGDDPTCVGYTLVGLTPYDGAITELNALVGFNGALTYSYNYEKYMNVGEYVITSVIDALESTNYYFVADTATLTVEAYKLNGIVTANGEAVLDVTYGDKTPEYAVVLNAASQAVVDGATAYGTNDIVFVFDGYVEGDFVGAYAATVALDGTENFVIEVIEDATVNVAKRNITIIADDITVEYGDEPVYTVTFDGLADCDGVEVNGKIVLNDFAKTHITLNEVFTIKYTTADPAGTVRPILMAGYGFESENYNVVAKIDGELTVDKRVIDVTVETLKVTYGEAIDLSKLTYVIENNRFVEGDTFETIFVPVAKIYTYATTNYTVGTVVADSGKVKVTITGIEAANYELNITYEGVEIEKRNVTLTINNFDVMYGEQPDQTGKFTLGAVYGEDKVNVTLVYVDYVAGAVNAGETCVIEATIDNPNYTVVYDAATLTVVKKTVTITIGNIDNTNKSVVYGNQVAQGTLSYADVVVEGFFGTQGITFDLYTDYDRYEDVGNYKISVDLETIVAKDGTNLDNYDITVVDGVLTVYKKETRITVELSSTTIYGEDPDFEVVFTKIARDEDVIIDLTKVTFVLNTKADGTGDAYVPGSPVGTYYIIPVFNAEDVNKNYNLGINTVKFEVVAKSITVKANDKTIEFNQDPANAGYTAEGILAKDLADFEAALLYTFNYVKGDKAGEYIITVALNDEYTNANYNFTFETGTLTVTKIVITVKVNVNAITYGDAFESDCQITNIEDIEDLITGVAVYTTDYNTADVAKRGVGEYTVTVSGINPADADNYEIKVDINKLVVNKLAIKVNANNGTATYGDATAVVEVLTYETLPYAEDNALFDANYSIEYTYVQGTTVAGAYAITVVEKEELANYDVTLVDGVLTVSKKAITFTLAAFDSIYYGNAEPKYVPVFADGVFYGDDTFENSFVGNLTIDAKAYAVGTPVGQYAVTADVSKLYSDKYDIALEGEYKLVVNARPVTITVDNKTITYGDELPEYTVTIGGEGFAPGHTLANLGTINEYYDTYDEGGDAGEYVINIVFTQNATYAGNYAITIVAGTLKVEAKELVITPDALLKLKGTEDPTFTYTYTGLLEGETVEFIGALGRAEGEEVGTYAITLGTLKVLSNNYKLVLENVNFTIAGVTITNKNLTLGLRSDIYMDYTFIVNVAGVFEFATGNDAFGILQWTEEEYANITNELYNDKYAYYGVYDSETHELKVNGQAIASPDYSKTFYARAYVKLADGTYVYGNVISYSVADYANYFFNVAGQTELKALLVALLDYGTAAQNYFGDTSVAANAIVTDEIRAAVNATKYDESMNPVVDSSLKKVEGAEYNATIDWFVATASFGTTFKINFYGIAANDSYVVSGDNANFGMVYWTEADVVDGKFNAEKATAAEVTVDGLGRYMFTYDDIAAAEGADRIYAAMWVKDAEGNISYSRVTYMSIKDYAYTMMSLTDNAKYEAIVELGQATIVYIEAAKSYFAD